jgi:Amt family ammonium transporter
VCVTPAAGFVQPYYGSLFGIVGGSVCKVLSGLKTRIGLDDALDAFVVHGIAGTTGSIMTGLFASSSVTELVGIQIKGGWVDGHYAQMWIQIVCVLATMAWSFIVTYVLLVVMNKIPQLRLRLDADEERL